MKVKAYLLHNHAAPLQRSPSERDWVQANQGVYDNLSLDSTNSKGWILQCPHAFEATWNGGSEAGDIEIQLDEPQAPDLGFVQSHLGDGLLTLHSGYQFKTEDEHALWVRGPINWPKDGLTPLEQIVDASMFPCTVTIHWKFTCPNQTVRFEAGEPFCTILPYPKHYDENFVEEVVGIEAELEVFEQEFQQLVQAPAVQRALQKLSSTGEAAISERAATTTPDTVNGRGKQTDDEALFLPHPYVIPPPQPMAAEAVRTLFNGTYPASISVILAASNESVLLQRTVEQFEATLPANSEIIVVDDGSTDSCADFLADCERDDVHLIHTPAPLGVSQARNRGLTQAQGEVVVFADAHIDLPERWWQPIVATLNRPNVGVVGPGLGVMGKPKLPAACGQRIAKPNLRLEWLFGQAEAAHPVPTLGSGFMAMRHDTLKQVGTFDIGIPQRGPADLELCVRYWLLGYEVWVVPEVTVLRHFRKTNPDPVGWGAMAPNLLRIAFLYFNDERLARVVSAFKNDARYQEALAYAADSAVWQQRADFAARRVRDDDWLFKRFEDSCSV